jgi:hypothetical protein
MAVFILIALVTAPDRDPRVAEPVPTTTVSTTLPPQADDTDRPPGPVTEIPKPETDPAPEVDTLVAGPDTTVADPADTIPPLLVVSTPSDGEHFTSAVITFTGVTDPEAQVVAAGKFSAVVQADGSWSIDLVLSPGANGAHFVATDEAGNETSVGLVVYLDESAPPPPEEEDKEPPPPPPPPTVEFTALQTYGSCEEDPPYDVFHGTADPGTTVTVTSEYGSGSALAGDEGEWVVTVFFPEAPHGEPFVVKATDHTGAKRTFEFVSYAGG